MLSEPEGLRDAAPGVGLGQAPPTRVPRWCQIWGPGGLCSFPWPWRPWDPHPTPQHTAASPHVSTPREILALTRVCTRTPDKPTRAGTSDHRLVHSPPLRVNTTSSRVWATRCPGSWLDVTLGTSVRLSPRGISVSTSGRCKVNCHPQRGWPRQPVRQGPE